jgi:hypothetical protein
LAVTLGILVAMVSLSASADVINFPDPGLEAAIRQAIGKSTGGIHDSDLPGLTFLFVDNRSISSLEGIQYCVDLTDLYLWDNQISDISPLSSLTGLIKLGLGKNEIVDISPLSGLTNLVDLALGENEIIDFSVLSGLTNLRALYLWGSQISNISTLSGLTKLVVLEVDGNQIVNITALSNLTSLTLLYLQDNQIADIQALVDNAGLGVGDEIDIRHNYLDLTPGSSNMRDIQGLIARGVDVEYEPQGTPENRPPTREYRQGDPIRATARFNVRNDADEVMAQANPGDSGVVLGSEPRVILIEGDPKVFWEVNWTTAQGVGGVDTARDLSLKGWCAESWLLHEDVYWLSMAITNEARGETEAEQIGVGWTILNRMARPSRFSGNSCQDIILRGYWPHWSIPPKQPSDESIINSAEQLLSPSPPSDPTQGADHFFSPKSQESTDSGKLPIPGTDDLSYYAPWAKPHGLAGWASITSGISSYVTVGADGHTKMLEWRDLSSFGIENWNFMFYRPYTLSIDAEAKSPVELRIIDAEGRVTGIKDGVERVEIPGSEVIGHAISIEYPDGEYCYVVEGIGEGSYGLQITSTTRDGTRAFTAVEIATAPRAVHTYAINWEMLENGEKGVTLHLDEDGDGVSEEQIAFGSHLTAEEFLKHSSTRTCHDTGWLLPTAVLVVLGTVFAGLLLRWRTRRRA